MPSDDPRQARLVRLLMRAAILGAWALALPRVSIAAAQEPPTLLHLPEHFSRWPEATITWRYDGANAPLACPAEVMLPEIRGAFQSWAGAAGLQFVETDNSSAQVQLSWASDLATPGLTNASTLSDPERRLGYRPFKAPVVVRLHRAGFEDVDLEGSGRVRSLRRLLLHELGHAIGIPHDADLRSVMSVKSPVESSSLTPSDIAAVQEYYGPATAVVRAPDSLISSAVQSGVIREVFLETRPGVALGTVSRESVEWLWVSFSASQDKPHEFTISLVDYDEVLLAQAVWTSAAPECAAPPGCHGRVALMPLSWLAELPGPKVVHVRDEAHLYALSSFTVPGDRFERPLPSLRLIASPEEVGVGDPVVLEVHGASDGRSEPLTLTWHVPTLGELRLNPSAAPALTKRTVAFPAPGSYEVFVSVTGREPRLAQRGGDVIQDLGFDFRGIARSVVRVTHATEKPQPSRPAAKSKEIAIRGSLTWMSRDSGSEVDWYQANETCENLVLDGHADWRLPTIDELEGLHDPERDGKHEIVFPIELTGDWVWSSTMRDSTVAYRFHFLLALRNEVHTADYGTGHRALCVRRSSIGVEDRKS